MKNFQGVLGNEKFVSNRSQQSKQFPSISNCFWLGASKSTQKTYNHWRLSAIYFIKISPWWSTESQIWTVERKRHIYSNPHKGENGKKLLRNKKVGGNDEKCREGPKRQSLSNSCFKVSKWTPLNLFHLSCKDQINISVKNES